MMDETGDYACGNHHANPRPSVWVRITGRGCVGACTGPRSGESQSASNNLVIPHFSSNTRHSWNVPTACALWRNSSPLTPMVFQTAVIVIGLTIVELFNFL